MNRALSQFVNSVELVALKHSFVLSSLCHTHNQPGAAEVNTKLNEVQTVTQTTIQNSNTEQTKRDLKIDMPNQLTVYQANLVKTVKIRFGEFNGDN